MFTDGEGRLRPLWAFAISTALSYAAFLAANYVAAVLTGDHVLRFEAIFRPLLAAVLLAIFSWLLTIGNHVEAHRVAAQGLPLSPGWACQFGAGCGLGLLFVVIAVLAEVVWGNLSFRTAFNLHSAARSLVVIVVLLAGSLAEELMFRGYPFQRLVEAIGAGGAILVFSVLFGAVHLINPGASAWGLINTVAIGVWLSVAYLRTRALWLPWGFHFAWNLTLGLMLGLPVSGLRLFNVVIRANATGPAWLTGGPYGPEASVPVAIVIAMGLLIAWKAPLQRLENPAELSPTENQFEPRPPNVTN